MQTNPFLRKIRADKDGNISFRKDLYPIKTGLSPSENLYLMFSVPSIQKQFGADLLDVWVGSRVTQWRVRKSLKAKGYL